LFFKVVIERCYARVGFGLISKKVKGLFAGRINDEGKKIKNIGLQMLQKNNCGMLELTGPIHKLPYQQHFIFFITYKFAKL
jgi:hypothetical protein